MSRVAVAVPLLAAMMVAATVGVADAHHAWNEVDTVRTVTLTGMVKSLKWENPHSSLVLETTDGGSTVDWTVLMSGIARMESHGVDAATVAIGKTLTIVASPARDEAHVVRANRIRSDGKEHVLY